MTDSYTLLVLCRSKESTLKKDNSAKSVKFRTDLMALDRLRDLRAHRFLCFSSIFLCFSYS